MGGATVFPRHIFHMHHNYSDTMAALQTSPYLTCLFLLQYKETETQQLENTPGKLRRKSHPAFLY